MSDSVPPLGEGSIVVELGLSTVVEAPEVYGTASVIDELCLPGTSTLRTSVLATWADIVTGVVAGLAIEPRIPLTLDLEVQLQRPVPRGAEVRVDAEAIKVGRSIILSEARFADAATGELFGFALVSFMASPDPAHVWEVGFPDMTRPGGQLAVPLADRVEGAVVEPGTYDLPWRPDGLNASGAIQGGLVVFGAEEAVRSVAPSSVATSLTIRYLRPFTVGPARSVADVRGDLAVVQMTDQGTGKLGAIVTMRLSGAAA